MSRSLDSILSEYANVATKLKKSNKKQTKRKAAATKNKKSAKGKGLLNDFINNLPVELHVPGYNYLGPGTKYNKRIKGDYGEKYQIPVNALDAAAMMHDKAYTQHDDVKSRTKADKALRKEAEAVYSNNYNPWGERATAYAVDKLFALKNFAGAGAKSKKGTKRKYTPKKAKQSNNNNNNNNMSAGYINDPVTMSELYDEDSESSDDEDEDDSIHLSETDEHLWAPVE